ncbi:12098_t:CDS:2, partial [Acaulospora morrowiae]
MSRPTLKALNMKFSEFTNVGFRIGKILTAIPLSKARKPAYKLQVDFGELGKKVSSAQLPANYTVDEVVGKTVIGVVNLPPRRVAGVKSEALIVGFPDSKDNVLLLNTRFQNPPIGSQLAEYGQQADEITYEDFQKADIRSATVLSVETLEENKNSFYIKLDVGEYGEKFAFLSDIDVETADSLVGSQVATLLNLDPEDISDKRYELDYIIKILQGKYHVFMEVGSAKSVKAFYIIQANCKYYGIDINPRMIQEARQNFLEKNIFDKAKVESMSFFDLDLSFKAFNPNEKVLIFLPFNLFGNLGDPKKSLEKLIKLSQDFIVSYYKINQTSYLARKEYYTNCGLYSLNYMEEDHQAKFTSSRGFCSITYSPEYIESIINKLVKELKVPYKLEIEHDSFNCIGM